MSRSRKKTPVAGWTTAASEKESKKIINGRIRSKTKQILKNPEKAQEAVFPIKEEILDIWSMEKDGKTYFSKNSKYYNKIIRK
jgi:hypothetical protein